MIHYHGLPLGGKKRNKAPFFRGGRNVLVSYHHPADIDLAIYLSKSYCLDNGAFSFWKSGGKMDYSGYVSFCRKCNRQRKFDFAIIPDIIDGTEKENDKYLDEWPGDLNGSPVFHLHESNDRLKRLMSNFGLICFGSSGEYQTPGSQVWSERMTGLMDIICHKSGTPKVKIHGLRMLNPDIFTKYPLHSADSTNAVINAKHLERFGMYPDPCQAERARTIARRIEQHESPSTWDGAGYFNQLKLF